MVKLGAVLIAAFTMIAILPVTARAAGCPPAVQAAEPQCTDFILNTAAINGSTDSHSFTADEMTVTTIGLSQVTLTDTSAPLGSIGDADDFVEIGLISVVNFQNDNLNVPVIISGINFTYELIAQFQLVGTARVNPAGNLVATIFPGSTATIFYDETPDSAIGPNPKPVAKLTNGSGDCVITAATAFTQGSCKLRFLFDGSGVTDPGVWTTPNGADIGSQQPAFIVIDINVNNVVPGFSLVYPNGPGSSQTATLDSDGSAILTVSDTPGNNDSKKPGSVLVFHKFIRGTVQVGSTTTRPTSPIREPKTSFEVSVTCPPGSTCAEGQKVRLLARWVCPGSQRLSSKFICKETDFELSTTVKGTLWFNPENVGSRNVDVPQPNCPLGYLLVWVVAPEDGSNPPAIKFDGLVGDAVIREGNQSAGAYIPLPIQAIDALATGARTDVNLDNRLQFDGQTEYKAITGKVLGSVRYQRTNFPAGTNLGRIDTFLTLLTLDARSSRPNLPTFVDLHFFNENEVLLSASHEFICWSEVLLTDIDPNLDQFFGLKGLVESTEAEKVAIFGIQDIPGPVTLIGIVETKERNQNGNIIREYAYELFNDGLPVPTVFAP